MAEATRFPYAGLAGAETGVSAAFALGHGISVSRTYAHLMAPFLLAFAPAPPGGSYPTPWAGADDGLAFDILAELYVPTAIETDLGLTLESVAWWITAMIRLRVGPRLVVPVLSSHPFAEAKDPRKAPRFRPLEVDQTILNLDPQARTVITEVDLQWVKCHWASSLDLIRSKSSFRLLAQAVDQCMFARHANLSLLWLWGGLEGLFSPAKAELRYRISSLIASFLEPAGLGRMSLQKSVAKLYDSRSAAAHGREETAPKHSETYTIAKRVILKIIEENHVPTHAQLEAKLFGVDPP